MVTANHFLYIAPFLFLGCSQGKTVVETDPDLGYITTYHVDPKSGKYHGPYEKTDSTGLLLERGNFNQGLNDGFRELYYPDGKIKVRERYKLGQMDDLYENFYPNGKHQLKGYYVDGAMYGLWMNYDEDGHVTAEVTLIKNEEMGPFKEYYPDGTLQAEGTYLHGPNEDGTLKLYDESGQLHKQMLCYSGKCYTTWQKEQKE